MNTIKHYSHDALGLGALLMLMLLAIVVANLAAGAVILLGETLLG